MRSDDLGKRVHDLEIQLAAAQESLARSQQDLTWALQVARSCIYETDPDLRLTKIVGDTQEILGAPAAELLGKTLGECLVIDTWPGDDGPIRNLMGPTCDGARHIQLNGNPLRDAAGRFLGYHGVINDAEALFAAEERAATNHRRFREAIECIPASLMLFDADDRLVICNSASQDFFPSARDLLVPGSTFEEILRADIAGGHVWKVDMSVDEWVAERVAHHRAANLDVVGARSDGRWIQVIERPTTDGGVIGIRINITELKQKEAELEDKTRQLEARGIELVDAKDAAEAADRAKSQFLAHMSHELRTPLNAIIGFSSMMSMETWGPLGHASYREYASDINQSGVHLLELINEILDLSKIAAGKFEIDETSVCVPAVVEDCIHMVGMRAQTAGLKLVVNVPPGLRPLYADERMVKRILLNLLSNAIKFTDAGHVEIAAWRRRRGGISLRVKDTGIGIPASELPRLMRPFMQATGTVRRKHEGTGLGLSLVKSMIELHGGEVEVASEVGVGTAVTVHFPGGRTLAAEIAPPPQEPVVREAAVEMADD